MKIRKNLYKLCSILGILFFSIGITASAQTTHFYPTEGTSSIYRWNFDGFPNVCVMNSENSDPNELDQFECVDNPTYAEFSVSYGMSGVFLEEQVEGYIHNASVEYKFMSSFLINTSTREYVDEKGEVSSLGFACGYIDPRNMSKGTLVMVGETEVETIAKENIHVTGISREAWKLEYKSESRNETYYYDVLTGILLDAKLVTSGGSIGGAAEINSPKQTLISREQILISTNAWESESVKVTTSSSIVYVLGLFIIMIITRRKT